MANRIVPLRTLVRSIGNSHEEFNEILRRIHREVMESSEDTIVISQIVGTFYRQRRRETRRVLNGVEYILPARDVLQLRPPPMASQPAPEKENILRGDSSTITESDTEVGNENQVQIFDLRDQQFEVTSVCIRSDSQFSNLLTIGGVSFSPEDFEQNNLNPFGDLPLSRGLRQPVEVAFRQDGQRLYVVIESDERLEGVGLHAESIVRYDIGVRFLVGSNS